MKFRIRFADQIVGVLIIVALASLAFAIVALGGSHRWFVRDALFNTEFASGTGISKNMPVLYRGFTIGNIKNFGLNEHDRVTVSFSIHAEYRDRVKLGSMVEIVVSPIGLGNQFLFHPGKGEELVAEEDFLPPIGSDMAKLFISQGLAEDIHHDDNISQLFNKVTVAIDEVNGLLATLNEAVGPGSDETQLGQIIGGVNKTIAGLETLPPSLDRTVNTLVGDIDSLLAEINGILAGVDPLLADLNHVTAMAASPDGTIASVLDAEGQVYASLVASLHSLSGILEGLDKTVAFIPGQLPQLAVLISSLQTTLKSADDVLVALTNNPLLKGGVPLKVEVQTTGTGPRDIQF